MKGKIKLVPEIDLVCDQLFHTEKLFVTNQKPTQLSVYTFKPAFSYTFQHLESNFNNLFEMELTSDLILPFLSFEKNDFFFVTGVGCEIGCVGTTESNDILYMSVRVTCKIKLNINENSKTWMFNFLDRSNYLT